MSDLTILVNGKPESLSAGATIEDLLRAVSISPERRGIAVAVNNEVVRRVDWNERTLDDADRVDVIQATQGG